jgi:hypothetical protein
MILEKGIKQIEKRPDHLSAISVINNAITSKAVQIHQVVQIVQVIIRVSSKLCFPLGLTSSLPNFQFLLLLIPTTSLQITNFQLLILL